MAQQKGSKSKSKMEFASMASVKEATSTTRITQVTRDNINTYLSDPSKYAKELRAVSNLFYMSNGIYKQIVNAFKNLATLDYVVTPSTATLKKVTDKAYEDYYIKVKDYLDDVNVKRLTRNILTSVARYGAYIGYERIEKGQVIYQTLPLDYCRIKHRVGNEFQIQFNFKYFDNFYDKENLDYVWSAYPKEFKVLYNKYKKDNKTTEPEWQDLDIKRTICIPVDDDDLDFLPMFVGMFEPILSNEEYKDMIKDGEKLSIIKMIVQKVLVDKDNHVAMSKGEVEALHKMLEAVLPEGAIGITTPLAISEVPFKNPSNEKEDLLSKSERNVFVSSGMSSSLFAESGGHAGLKMNLEIITANIFGILEKIEDSLNKKIKQIVKTRTYTFKIKFFRITNVNIEETFSRLFQLVSIGGAMSPLYSCIGFDEDMYNSMLFMENENKIKDLLVPPQSMNTMSGSSADEKESGRPQEKEENLSDEGQKQRDLDANNNSEKGVN